MARDGLVGAWEVNAGVIPGTVEPEHSRIFPYTGTMYDEDQKRTEPSTEANPSNFCKVMDEAYTYAKTITNPQYLNWVRVFWIWF